MMVEMVGDDGVVLTQEDGVKDQGEAGV